jgi:oligopeptide transport system substrate-binding protein
MRKRHALFTFAVLVTSLAVVAAACSSGGPNKPTSTSGASATGSPKAGGTLTLTAQDDLTSLDNSQAVSPIDYEMTAGALYEGLYHMNHDGHVEPGIADGMPQVSSDGLTYTIHLQHGAMFAGPNFTPREVTATDAAYGMTRALDPNTKPAPSWGGYWLYPIDGAFDFTNGKASSVSGIKVVDKYTLQLTLSAPDTTFIYSLTNDTNWPVPKEAVEQRGLDFASEPVGAGPFYVKTWTKGQSIVLARNPGYVAKGLPYLDQITLDLNVNPSTEVLRLQSGQSDGLFEPFTLPQANIRQLSGDANVTKEPTVGLATYFPSLNFQGMFANKDLRLAVAYAVTRDFTKQFGSTAKPFFQIYADGTPQYDPSEHFFPHDPAKARQELRAAGYHGQPVRMIYDLADSYVTAMMVSLAQDLRSIGMNVQLKGLQESQFFGSNGQNDPKSYDIVSNWWRYDYPDGEDYLSSLFLCFDVAPPGLDLSRYCSKRVDSLFNQSNAMPFGPARDKVLQQAQRQLLDDVAAVPVMQVTPLEFFSSKVGDIPSLPTFAPFDWKLAWVKAGS